MPFFLTSMEQPYTPSAVEATFLNRVLGLNLIFNFKYLEEKKAELDKTKAALQKDIATQLSLLESNWNLKDQNEIKKHEQQLLSRMAQIESQAICHLKEKEKFEQIFQEKETYEQFIRWHQRPSQTKLRDLKFLFNKMALENNTYGMQAVEALALEWKLIANPEEKSEKLDYLGALIDAADNGKGDATEYLINKKNISLKNMSSTILGQICWGKWGSSYWHGFKETQQKNIVRLMIKKGAPSRLNDIRMYLLIAQESDAPERLIKYLKEVETSRRNS